jgi:hypothetical protein
VQTGQTNVENQKFRWKLRLFGNRHVLQQEHSIGIIHPAPFTVEVIVYGTWSTGDAKTRRFASLEAVKADSVITSFTAMPKMVCSIW